MRDALQREVAETEQDSELISKVDLRVHPDDSMYRGDPAHYFGVGLSAVRCVRTALGDVDLQGAPVLDFACGYGRVLRFLAVAYPQADFTGAEIQRRARRFCHSRFGAKPWAVPRDPLGLEPIGGQELIWCGSLLTHLDEQRATAVLQVFSDSLVPGGTAVLTTQGDRVAASPPAGLFLAVDDRHVGDPMDAYRRCGYGHVPYQGENLYGVSLTSAEWMHRTAPEVGLEITWHGEQAWDAFQDVFALRRR